jgi:hypothetical protein
MSLHIQYRYSCDYCKRDAHKPEEYQVMPFMSAQNKAWPMPSHDGMGIGGLMACEDCLGVARRALLEKRPIKMDVT